MLLFKLLKESNNNLFFINSLAIHLVNDNSRKNSKICNSTLLFKMSLHKYGISIIFICWDSFQYFVTIHSSELLSIPVLVNCWLTFAMICHNYRSIDFIFKVFTMKQQYDLHIAFTLFEIKERNVFCLQHWQNRTSGHILCQYWIRYWIKNCLFFD